MATDPDDMHAVAAGSCEAASAQGLAAPWCTGRTAAHLVASAVFLLVLVTGCGGDGGAATASSSTGALSSATASTSTGTATGSASATLSASQAFLATLSADQKNTVVADRTPANLSQWSNLPDPLFERAGLRMNCLGDAQQKAVRAILQAALSPEGYRQVNQITAADSVLASTAGSDHPDFGADHYWIRFVGEPSASSAYTIQYGGHHLALNVTAKGSSMTIAPTHWGAEPASYQEAGSDVEPLSGETTKAFALMESLSGPQQQQAILDTPIREIVLGARQDGKSLSPEGVKASTFTATQKAQLLDLVTEWLTTLNAENSAAKVDRATAELDQMSFAWSGDTTIDRPIYYRVQSPTFIVEFAHQQGQGPRAGGITHIHSIYREIGNDYAGDTGR